LLPLVGENGILGVALSGAGPAVLVVVEGEDRLPAAASVVEKATENRVLAELTICRFSQVGASQNIESK
jgi:homoserine kinase